MEFFQRLFGSGTQSSSSVQDLTKKEVDDAENDFLKEYKPNPSNQEIAEKLGRHVNEVNVIRIPPPHSQSHRHYKDKYYEPGELSSRPLKSDGVIKTLQPLQGRSMGGKSKKNVNKNNKKLSRRRSNKKNRKSMKRN